MKNISALKTTNKTKSKPIAFFLCSNASIDMVLLLSRTTDEELFVFCRRITDSQKIELTNRKIKFSADIQFTRLNIASFSVVITMGLLPHKAHVDILKLCANYKKLGGKIIDFQHGLFQWGINFTDTSLEQGFMQNSSTGISLPIESFADKEITWFNDGVGYPRTILCTTPKIDDNYVLIATNTNWHIYSNEEKVKFANIIYKHIKKNQDLYFIWKPHPAEFNPELSPILDLFNFESLSNLEIIRHGEVKYSLTKLVERCSYGIATVGTSLLDFAVYEKKCLVFNTRAVSNLISSFEESSSFKCIDSLSKDKLVPKYKRLSKFKHEQFWSIVNEYKSNLKYSNSLNVIFEG